MTLLRFLRFLVLRAALAFALLLSGSRAFAQPAEPPPVRLVVFGDLPREQLRERLARELGRPVELAAARTNDAVPQITVTWRRDELAVAYDEPGRGTVSRVVPGRPTAEATVEDAVLLSASLVKNEADELLGQKAPELTPLPPAAPPETTEKPEPKPAPARPAEDYVPAYVSLFHPASSLAKTPYARTHFGLNLLYGRAGELDNGLQLGLVNVITGGDGKASGRMSGVQLAPLFGLNYASGAADGLQLAHLANASGGLTGTQIAMGANVSAGKTDGAQIAMGANVSTHDLRGGQLAAVNVARDVSGVQLGFLNVAKKVEGVTLGLVNVADDVDGVPIGLISVTKSGGVHPVLWSSTSAYANAGLKFATRYTYTMVAGHWIHEGARSYDGEGGPLTLEGRDFVGGGFFLGGHVPLDRAFVDFDLSASPHIATRKTARSDNPQVRYNEVLVDARARAMGGVTILPHLSLFVGVGAVLRVRIVDDGADGLYRVMPELFGGVQF